MRDAVEIEEDRIHALRGHLHPFTIKMLLKTIHQRLKHPKYQLPVAR